ncbi:MAG: hypothetical protein V1738_01695 [Patescibacteria group bacterium]
MAKKKNAAKKPGMDRQLLARIITVIVVVLVASGIVVTVIFISNILNRMSGDSFRLTEEDEQSIETIDLERLSELRDKIDDKNKLDEARAGRLRNPFAEPAPEPEPEPLPELIPNEPSAESEATEGTEIISPTE